MPLLIATFVAIVVGAALLLLAVIAALLHWRDAREAARLALWDEMTLLVGGILFLALFQKRIVLYGRVWLKTLRGR